MEKVELTCIECPVGCRIEVNVDEGKVVSVVGNGCPRGKMYAENEVVCPKRVVTSTVRLTDGRLLPVKTNVPVPKSKIFYVMDKIRRLSASAPVSIGDVICRDICDGADLVASGNA